MMQTENPVCALFGHRHVESGLGAILDRAIEHMIVDRGVRTFLVGGQGEFDRMAIAALVRMKAKYPFLDAAEVLAYPPRGGEHPLPTIYPEGLERVPKRLCYLRRNDWMARQADVVLAYVRARGGAAKGVETARRLGKEIQYLIQ